MNKSNRSSKSWRRLVLTTLIWVQMLALYAPVHGQTAPAGVRREIYWSLPGGAVTQLTDASKFPNEPDIVDVVDSLESKWRDNYGQRISGVLVPPVSGSYVFYIASDDQSQLFISTDESPVNKSLIAFEPEWNGRRDYLGTGRRDSSNPENRSDPIDLVAGQSYCLEVLHADGAFGDHVAVAWQMPGEAPPENNSDPIAATHFPAGLRREIYLNIGGGAVTELTSAAHFPSAPDLVDTLNAVESTPEFGERLSAFLIPPTTGAYRFYVAADDQAELFISTDETVANKRLVAFEPEWNGNRDYLGTARRDSESPENRSESIELVAGQKYYMEVLHKVDAFAGQVAIAWQKPGDDPPANGSDPIPGSQLLVFQVNQAPTLDPIPNPPAILEDSGQQTISLTGISAGPTDGPSAESWQSVTVIARSSNPSLIPDPVVSYTSPDATATLSYTPVPLRDGTATITVEVRDNGGTANGGIDLATRQFDVAIDNINHDPILDWINGAVTLENQELRFRAVATDVDGDALTFSLDPGAPAGATVDPSSGLFSWTPTEEQGPGAYPIRVRVRDNGQPNFSAARDFVVQVQESNLAPRIEPVAARTLGAGETLRIQLEARDDDLPANGLIYELGTGAPIGITLNEATGELIWETGEFDGTSANLITVNVVDDGTPRLSATTSFLVTVEGENHRPVMASVAVQTVAVGETFSVLNAAADLDKPSQKLAWSLGEGAPVGMTIDADRGRIEWTPSAEGVYRVTVNVRDNGDPVLSASQVLTVIVRQSTGTPVPPEDSTSNGEDVPVKTGPTITSQPENQTVDAGSNVSFRVEAVGSEPLSYQWFFNEMPIREATSAVLDLQNVQRTAVGRYSVSVTSTEGSNTSAIATLTVVPRKGDLDGDGLSDVVFQDADGFLAVWFMDQWTLKTAAFLDPAHVGNSKYRVVDSGDFNRDGQEDLLFQRPDGTLAVWFMEEAKLGSASLLNPSHIGDPSWRAVAVGDMNGDGRVDIVFQRANGDLHVEYLDGIELTSSGLFIPFTSGSADWRAVAVADLNTDGASDLLFQHTDGTLGVWYLDGTVLKEATLLTPEKPSDSQWRVVGVADRNGDKQPDLLFQHEAKGALGLWLLNGAELINAERVNPSSPGGSWRVVAP